MKSQAAPNLLFDNFDEPTAHPSPASPFRAQGQGQLRGARVQLPDDFLRVHNSFPSPFATASTCIIYSLSFSVLLSHVFHTSLSPLNAVCVFVCFLLNCVVRAAPPARSGPSLDGGRAAGHDAAGAPPPHLHHISTVCLCLCALSHYLLYHYFFSLSS